MLSIIICSINIDYLNQLKKNLENSIGVEYEILVWDNRNKNLGLCEVYNLLAAEAQYPFLCFIHEDIEFITKNWGVIICNLFNSNSKVALIGVAGGKYKAAKFSGWFTGIPGMDYYHISHINGSKVLKLSNSETWPETSPAVVCIDGVFMAVRKEIWEAYRFDADNYKAFHFYDIDFSLRISGDWKVIVTDQINILHFTTGGDYGEKWVKEAFSFHRNHKNKLPYSNEKVVVERAELITAKTWLERLKTEKIDFGTRWKWISLQGLERHMSLWSGIIVFLFYRISGFYWTMLQLKKIKAMMKKNKIG